MLIFASCAGLYASAQESEVKKDTTAEADIQQDTQAPPVVPLIDGVSSRLVITQSEHRLFPKTSFYTGVFGESLYFPTKSQYSSTGWGFHAGFLQHVKEDWDGGLELRVSNWHIRNSAPVEEMVAPQEDRITPLSLFSKVEWVPKGVAFWKEGDDTLVKPFFAGGLGYTLFLTEKSWAPAVEKGTSGEVSMSAGLGIRMIFSNSFGIRMGSELWRGVQTSRYQGQIYYFSILWGDNKNL